MASLKLTLRKRCNKDGSFPIVLRVIIDRSVSYISCGLSVQLQHWDDGAERIRKGALDNITRANALLLKKKTAAQERIWQLESLGQAVTLDAIRQAVSGNGGNANNGKNNHTPDFFALADRFVMNLLRAGKYNRYKTENGRVAIFREYLGVNSLSFEQVTVGLLQGFISYLKGGRGIKERTIANYMILIRSIYNMGLQEHLVSRDHYPFGKGKITIKLPEAVKVGLTMSEIQSLEQATLTGYNAHARRVWLLSFYFAGMRLSDILRLQWTDFKDGRLTYAMSKNNKIGSLKIPAKAQAVLEHYKHNHTVTIPPAPQNLPSLYVLPELQGYEQADAYTVQRRIAHSGKRLEKALKQIAQELNIDKKLSMHIARHSFAQIAADKIPVQVLQKLYRHSHISTTVGYQSHFTTQHTDAALDQVIGDG